MQNALFGDHALAHVLQAGQLVHNVEHDLFDDRTQSAGAGLALDGLANDGHHRLLVEAQLDVLQFKELLVLLHQAVLGLPEDLDEHVFAELIEGHDHRETTDEFGDHPELHDVLGAHVAQQVVAAFQALGEVRAKAHLALADAPRDDVGETLEGAAGDEEDVAGIDLDELLLGAISRSLRGDHHFRALDHLQERLLHAFAAHVAGGGGAVAATADLVDLVDADDPAAGALDIAVGGKPEVFDDVFDVFAHVARLGETGGVGDGEGHVELFGQRLRHQRLTAAGGADEQDVALGQLHAHIFLMGLFAGGFQLRAADALVMRSEEHTSELQ